MFLIMLSVSLWCLKISELTLYSKLYYIVKCIIMIDNGIRRSDMISKTSIAILMATYNGEHFLQEQIESILGQSFSDWSIFIHDDGSIDGTNRIIDRYVENYPGKINRIDGKTTGSAKNNFFYLMNQVEASYYMFCDQDDIWMDKKIETTWERMKNIEKKDRPSLVFTELSVVSQDKTLLAESMSKYQNLDCTKLSINHIIIQNVVTGCTMMVNRRLRDMMISTTNIENIRMHDWWAGVIAAAFGEISFVEEPTIWYRQHDDNSVGAQNDNSVEYQINRVKNKESMRYSLELTRMQAKEAVEVFHLPKEHIISQYANCMNMGKIKRLVFYFKNGILKTGIARLLGQIVLG